MYKRGIVVNFMFMLKKVSFKHIQKCHISRNKIHVQYLINIIAGPSPKNHAHPQLILGIKKSKIYIIAISFSTYPRSIKSFWDLQLP